MGDRGGARRPSEGPTFDAVDEPQGSGGAQAGGGLGSHWAQDFTRALSDAIVDSPGTFARTVEAQGAHIHGFLFSPFEEKEGAAGSQGSREVEAERPAPSEISINAPLGSPFGTSGRDLRRMGKAGSPTSRPEKHGSGMKAHSGRIKAHNDSPERRALPGQGVGAAPLDMPRGRIKAQSPEHRSPPGDQGGAAGGLEGQGGGGKVHDGRHATAVAQATSAAAAAAEAAADSIVFEMRRREREGGGERPASGDWGAALGRTGSSGSGGGVLGRTASSGALVPRKASVSPDGGRASRQPGGGLDPALWAQNGVWMPEIGSTTDQQTGSFNLGSSTSRRPTTNTSPPPQAQGTPSGLGKGQVSPSNRILSRGASLNASQMGSAQRPVAPRGGGACRWIRARAARSRGG